LEQKKIVEAIKELVTDATFDCSPDGMAVQAMDSSHVSLISMFLERDGFAEYSCVKRPQLGIKLDSMGKILKCSANDDVVTIRADEGGDVINFTFEGKTKVSDFELKLVTLESDSLAIPETEYAAVIQMSSSEFQRICKDLTCIGDTVTISCKKTFVEFSSAGDLGKGKISIKENEAMDADEDAKTHIKSQEPVELNFALRYLNFFTKATALSNKVTLSLSKEVPLVVEYQIENLGYIRYYLAPKIEED